MSSGASAWLDSLLYDDATPTVDVLLVDEPRSMQMVSVIPELPGVMELG